MAAVVTTPPSQRPFGLPWIRQVGSWPGHLLSNGHTDAAMLYLLVLANTVLVWLGLFYGRAQADLLAQGLGLCIRTFFVGAPVRACDHPQRLLGEP